MSKCKFISNNTKNLVTQLYFQLLIHDSQKKKKKINTSPSLVNSHKITQKQEN